MFDALPCAFVLRVIHRFVHSGACPQGGDKVVHRVWVGLWITVAGGGGWRRVVRVFVVLTGATVSLETFPYDLTSAGGCCTLSLVGGNAPPTTY